MTAAQTLHPGVKARWLLAAVLLVGTAGTPAKAIDRIAWISELGLGEGRPIVVLPLGAGPTIGIDERRKTNSFVQVVTMAGDAGTIGENRVQVTVTRDGLAPRIEEDTVSNELQKELPDFAMTLGPTGTRNAFGAFGAVMGSKGGRNCIYAWQRVNLADRWLTDDPKTVFDEAHALTIRYRLCRTTATTSALLSLVEGAQSGMFATRTMPRPPPGYDALTAATGLSARPLSTVDEDMGEANDLVVRRRPQRSRPPMPRPIRSNQSRDRAQEPAPNTEGSKAFLATMPEVPLP